MDLALVARDTDCEESSGVIYTEGTLAHELAHASSMYQSYATTDYKGFHTSRFGFCLPQNQTPWGLLLEEGWADLHRANYFAQHASKEEKEKLKNTLRYENLDMEDTLPIPTPAGYKLPIPIKYLFITTQGKPATRYSAYAGYALELLCKKDASIKSLLIEARSSTEGLRKLAQAIEKIMPGLYKTLQTGDYTEACFSEKLAFVISNVTGGIENAVTASGSLKDAWDRLLQK